MPTLETALDDVSEGTFLYEEGARALRVTGLEYEVGADGTVDGVVHYRDIRARSDETRDAEAVARDIVDGVFDLFVLTCISCDSEVEPISHAENELEVMEGYDCRCGAGGIFKYDKRRGEFTVTSLASTAPDR